MCVYILQEVNEQDLKPAGAGHKWYKNVQTKTQR